MGNHFVEYIIKSTVSRRKIRRGGGGADEAYRLWSSIHQIMMGGGGGGGGSLSTPITYLIKYCKETRVANLLHNSLTTV